MRQQQASQPDTEGGEPRFSGHAAHKARRTGILALCVGVLVFSLQDVIIKWIAGSYPIHQVMVLRSLVALPLLVVMVRFEAGLPALRARRPGILALRGFILLVCYTAFYLSLPALPLATAVALSFSSPLFIAALAGPMLGERLAPSRWLAVLFGFAGVMVVVRPGAGVFDVAAILPLLGAATYALAQILARRFGRDDASSVMALYQNGVFLLGGGILAAILGSGWVTGVTHPSVAFLVRPWVMPPALDLAMLLATGAIAGAGAYLLTHAYRIAEANAVAPFEYTSLIWATLWGYLVWTEVPDGATILGIAMILGASLYVSRAR